MMDRLSQELRTAVRVLIRNAGVTVAAVITLALGIGVNTAVFTVVNGALLRPLPYEDSDRIVAVWETDREGGRSVIGPLNFRDWQDQNETLEAIAAYGYEAFVLVEQGEPERLIGNTVTADFFEVFGMTPVLGRTFEPGADDPGGERTVVLSNGLWRRRFGADEGIVGRTLMLSGIAHTVIGVMPATFTYPSPNTQLWTSFAIDYAQTSRGSHYLFVVGRIAPNATLERARADVDRIARQLEAEYPDTNRNVGIALVPLLEETVGSARAALLVLLAAVGFVLLIACANVANLVLARASGRATEVAVRRALGAGTGRLTTQFMTEAALLTLTGGIAGVLLAFVSVRLLLRANPGLLPRAHEIAPDARVLGVALFVVLAVTIVLALVQTAALGRNHAASIRAGGRCLSSSRGRGRLRAALAVSQLALVLPLLAGAGLLMRTVRALRAVPTGFAVESVLTMNLSLAEEQYADPELQRAFVDGVLERARAVAGVEAIGVTSDLPFSGSRSTTTFAIEGDPDVPGNRSPSADHQQVSPGYFDAMGITILRGRALAETDRAGSPPVAVVNQTLALRYFAGREPIGARLIYGREPAHVEIVGIVADVVHDDLRAAPSAEIYVPFAQFPLTRIFLATRTHAPNAGLLDALRAAVGEVDPEQPIYSVRTMEERLAQSIAPERTMSRLVGVFSSLALLALIGLYAVISYGVASRAQELGVRSALGASPGKLAWLVLRQGTQLVAIGIALGALATLAGGRAIASLLFGVQPTDPATLVIGCALLFATALLACWVPARRATRTDPMVTMRL